MEQEQLDHLRHSCAHLLAAAVMELWPKTKRTIGPTIENGFYYDFDFGDVKVSEDDFEAAVDIAAALLKSGGTMVYPTDTVYGIGADATSGKLWKKSTK